MKIYFNNFWDDNKNISSFPFWKNLFSYINYKYCDEIENSDVVFNSVFSESYIFIFKNKRNVFITFEPIDIDSDFFYLNISYSESKNNYTKNIICPPQMLLSIYNSDIPRSLFLKNRPKRIQVPEKFCCFITRVEKPERVDFFNQLSKYKKVDSLGPLLNNTGILAPHEPYEFHKLISQYKFIITFENCQKELYITEKILHGFYSMTIPIYWGSKHIHEFFNNKSFIFIEEYNQENISSVIEQIKQIDTNDELYFNMVNQNVFRDNFDIDNYFDNIKKQIKNSLEN